MHPLFGGSPLYHFFLKMLVRSLQFLMSALFLGQVPRDFAEAQQMTSFIFDRGDDHVRPKPRSVFSQPPAFILESALFGCDLKFVPGLPRSQIFFRIKNRK